MNDEGSQTHENGRRRIANARRIALQRERERKEDENEHSARRKRKKGSRVNDNCPRFSSAIQKCNTLVRVCDFNTKNFRHIFYRACRFSLQRTGRGDDDDDVARKNGAAFLALLTCVLAFGTFFLGVDCAESIGETLGDTGRSPARITTEGDTKIYQEEDAFSGITDADDAAGVENGHYLFANENTTLSNVETSNKNSRKESRNTSATWHSRIGRGCKKQTCYLGKRNMI